MPETHSYEPTTERLDVDTHLESAHAYLIYLFHLKAYELAEARIPATSRVLDYGCGTGYGSSLLADSGRTVVGVDVSDAAIDYARSRYQSPRLTFASIPPVEQAPLPFADAAFDAVVSFQVIEHVPSVEAYLSEVARVLRPGGMFICATPDRTTRLFRGQRPWNRWHLDEFTEGGLAAAVADHLDVEEVMGMTAPEGVVDLELRRAQLLRVITLPFTFPGSPERWRVGGIESMRRLMEFAGRVRSRLFPRGRAEPERPRDASAYDFGAADIVIAAGARPSTNIVLTARRAEDAPPVPPQLSTTP